MTTLVLDTALHCAQAGVFRDATCLAMVSEEGTRGQAEVLIPAIEKAMTEAKAGWSDLSSVLVTVGPGVFTGIRSGLAAARALRLALGTPVSGIGTLQLLAAQKASARAVAVIDAHKDECYVQAFDGLRALSAPRLVKFAHLENELKNGGDVIAYPAPFAKRISEAFSQTAKTVAACERLDLAFAAACDKLPPAPLYVRAPDALPQQGSLLKRA